MCLYYTYHWSCCSGTAQAAPYYMNTRCEAATVQPPRNRKPARRVHKRPITVSGCRIEHKLLDGEDYDVPCPRCGSIDRIDGEQSIEDEIPTQLEQSIQSDSRFEQLAWSVGRILQQQEEIATLNKLGELPRQDR